ncbi:MAG: glutamate racemase [Fusobacteriaceae bacterium]
MEKNYSIGIFDSGVGGITVLKEIIDILPKENIIYVGDNKNSPYGEKTHEEILGYCERIIKFLIKKKCKVIVIACNTATATSLDILRKRYDIPIIGVIESGVKEAMKISRKKIAFLATPYTCSSGAYNREIAKYSENLEVVSVACKEWCPMIENGWENYPERDELLKKYIGNIPKDAESVILACTHYPIIREEIEKYIPSSLLVDPAYETAVELKNYLENRKLLRDKNEIGEMIFYITGRKDKFREITENFLNIKIKIEEIDI